MTRNVAKQQSQSNTLPPGKARKALRSDTPRSQIRIRVLILEDSQVDAELMIRALEQSGMLPEWERVETEPDFTARLTPPPDLILSDYALPHFSGMHALQLVRSRGLDVPFILVSGSIGEDVAVEAIRQGADDYLLKDRMARLGQAASRAIEKKKLRDEMRRAEDALQDSEERFRAAFEQAGVGMALRGIDPHNSRWLRVNQKLCDILGYTKEELLQLTSVDITPPEDRDLAIEYNEKLLKGEISSYSREKRYVRKDGRIIWANIALTGVSGPDGRRSHVISVIQDITDRKLQEQKIEKLIRVRAVSSEINAAIVRIREREALLRETCRIAIEFGKFRMIWIGMLDRTSMTVRPVIWVGFDDKFMRELRVPIRDDGPGGQGTTPRAARGKQAAWDNDFAANPGLGYVRRYALECGVRSAISLPLVIEGEIEGVFSLYAEETGFFTEDEIRMLEELASNVSLALEHILRQGKIERLSRTRAVSSGISSILVRVRDRQELFQESCRIAVEDGQFPFAWIGVLDPTTQDVTPVAWSGEGADELMKAKSSARDDTPRGMGAVGRAIRERRAVINNDIAAKQFGGPRVKEILKLGFRSQITLPLFVEKMVIGTLTMYAREPNFFDEEELRLLTELAGDISFALENIAKQQKLDKLARIRAVSSEINAAIVRVREPEALLRETCRIAAEHGKFEMVWVALVDQEKRQIKPVAWKGFSSETVQAVKWASIGAPGVTLGEVMRTLRLAVRNDIDAEQPTGILRQEALKKGFRSTVCLPFVVDEKLVAAMILFAAGRNFFVEDELTLLNEVAGNISFALENIARQQKIEKLSRIRAVLGEINAAIARIRNKQELFEEACRIMVMHGKFVMAWIGMLDEATQALIPVAKAGREEGYLERIKLTIDPNASKNLALSVEAMARQAPVVCNDIANDGRMRPWRSAALERGYHSMALLPLQQEQKAVGVIALYAPEPGFFDEEEAKLLVEMVGDMAFALQTIAKQERLDYLSYYDTLTGLPNRTLFVDRAGQQMRTRSGEPLIAALILLNLERFRNINETLGRHGGDELLKLVARRLEGTFNGKDYLARVGADVFGVVMRGIRDAAAIVHAVENQVLGCFRESFMVGDSELRVAAKAGIALHPADGADADTLYNNAEAALKKARDSGEHYLFYAADMNARATHMLSLETRLRKAVEARQFVLHYQPKINLSNDAICGLEALIRWNDPESGLVAPGTFIPLLEETGLILEVGKWALAQALTDHREWTARGCTVPGIAVNVSSIQLQRADFTETVIGVLQQGGGKPEALELEITESLLMKDVEASIRKLSILRGLGIHIAMDDFGTGYSSLSYIARLPINSVKIDRSFITGMARNPQDMSIVTTIIALAHSLNLRVVAEGVETREQSQLLKLLKCDEAQGYLFSKPLPAAEIEPMLRVLAPFSGA